MFPTIFYHNQVKAKCCVNSAKSMLSFCFRCWSTLLDVTTLNSAAKASQWWFHVYSSLVQFRMTEYAQEPRGKFCWFIVMV